MELGDLLLHDVGITCMPQPIYKFCRMGQQRLEPLAYMVRNLCVPSPINLSVRSDYKTAIRILLASSVGLPAASLCINRRLYLIANVKAIGMGHAEVRTSLYF